MPSSHLRSQTALRIVSNLGEVDVRDERVNEERERERQEQTDRTARRHETEREGVRVLLLPERRVQETADRDDRDAAAAREEREDRARDDADDRETAGHPPEDGSRRRDEAVGRLRLREDVPHEGVERDRDGDRRVGEPLVENGRREEPEVVVGRVGV
jgi:hypothetical protein